MKFILKLFVVLLAIISNQELKAQKLYIWCPKDQVAVPRTGLLEDETINLVIFDGRLITEKSKVECSAEVTVNSLANFIRDTYPSAKVQIIQSENYFKDPVSNSITVKIGIAAYHAAFGANVKIGIGSVGGKFAWGAIPEGKWNAMTGYNVSIYDYRDDQENKLTKEIAKTASKPNMGGYRTAKSILNSTYLEANQELLFFIDNTFMK